MKRHGLAWADKCVCVCFKLLLFLFSGSFLDDAFGLSAAVLAVTSRDAIDEE